MYYHANLWPDDQTSERSNSGYWTIFSVPYWQIFGEVDLELLTGKAKLFYFLFIPTIHSSLTFVLQDLYSPRKFFSLLIVT